MYTIVVITLAVLLAVGLAMGAPFLFAVPIALVGGGAVFAVVLARRRSSTGRMGELRGEARKASQDSGEVEFTERDRQTLAS